jgi:cytochrome c55X
LVLMGSAWSAPDPGRQKALEYLLRQDCGSCHGMTLKGGLGPPLTAKSLVGKPDELLVTSILEGRPGTAMPPWKPFLNADEAQWLVQQLRQPRR